jgi:hypothetical protein
MVASPQKQKWSPDQFLAFVAHIRKGMLTVSGDLLCILTPRSVKISSFWRLIQSKLSRLSHFVSYPIAKQPLLKLGLYTA